MTEPDPESPPPPRHERAAAIMFSDVVGYTAIMGRVEQKGLDAIAGHRERLGAILPRSHGRLVGEIGNGSLSSFDSVVEAVACARRLQAELREDQGLLLRIGIHLGDVASSGDTLVGEGVDIASQIHALAAPGGICVSADAGDEIRDRPGMNLKDLGEKNLQYVSRPIRVYALSEGPSPGPAPARSAPVSSPRPSRARSAALRRNLRPIAIGAAVVAAVALLVYGGVRWKRSSQAPAATVVAEIPVIRSIAVLPLDNYSGEPTEDYLADGITDELTTGLATLGQLSVISSGSAMRFKDGHRPPAPEIGRLLNVDAIVEGSVLRAGSKIRITVQLIDAKADKHLWTKSLERETRDVLALQAELVTAVAAEIRVQPTAGEQARLSSARPVVPEAHDAYLKGRDLSYRAGEEDLAPAIARFEEAVRLDPNFALAYSGLADAWLRTAVNDGAISAADAMAKAKEAAEKAIRLDDTLAEAHNSLAQFKCGYDYDWAGAEKEFRRSLELDPNYAYAHDRLGIMLAHLGRLDEALAEGTRATELSPLAPEMRADLSMTLTWQGKADAAVAECRRAQEIDPALFLPQAMLGWIDIETGKAAEAVPELEKAIAMDAPDWVRGWLGHAYGTSGYRERAQAILDEWDVRPTQRGIPPFGRALVHLGLGERGPALDELEKAYEAHSDSLMMLGIEHTMDPLRSEPRFTALLQKVGLGK